MLYGCLVACGKATGSVLRGLLLTQPAARMQSPGAAQAQWRHGVDDAYSSESSFEWGRNRDWARSLQREREREDDLHWQAQQQASDV